MTSASRSDNWSTWMSTELYAFLLASSFSDIARSWRWTSSRKLGIYQFFSFFLLIKLNKTSESIMSKRYVFITRPTDYLLNFSSRIFSDFSSAFFCKLSASCKVSICRSNGLVAVIKALEIAYSEKKNIYWGISITVYDGFDIPGIVHHAVLLHH